MFSLNFIWIITLLICFYYSVNGKKWIIKSNSQQRTISEQRTIAAARKCPLVGDSTVNMLGKLWNKLYTPCMFWAIIEWLTEHRRDNSLTYGTSHYKRKLGSSMEHIICVSVCVCMHVCACVSKLCACFSHILTCLYFIPPPSCHHVIPPPSCHHNYYLLFVIHWWRSLLVWWTKLQQIKASGVSIKTLLCLSLAKQYI